MLNEIVDTNEDNTRNLLSDIDLFVEKYGYEREGATQIRIGLTQSDIADLADASRKRVNQAMVLFKEQGMINTDAEGRITIHDCEGLACYCN